MLAVLLLIAAGDDAVLIERASRLTSAERRCIARPDGDDIVVCGLRRADRFRLPLVIHDAGDPRYESIDAERTRLLHRTTPIQDLSPFLVGGGMAGLTVKSSFGGPDGGQVSGGGLRKQAP